LIQSAKTFQSSVASVASGDKAPAIFNDQSVQLMSLPVKDIVFSAADFQELRMVITVISHPALPAL